MLSVKRELTKTEIEFGNKLKHSPLVHKIYRTIIVLAYRGSYSTKASPTVIRGAALYCSVRADKPVAGVFIYFSLRCDLRDPHAVINYTPS